MSNRQHRGLGLLGFILVMAWPIGAFSQDVPGNPQNGKVIFEKHCVQCHGAKGAGDGPDTQFLTVRPANFHSLESRSKTDGELMTVITYGAVFSPMHGWSERLTEDERWDVLRYIRLLAPFNPIAQLHPSPGSHG